MITVDRQVIVVDRYPVLASPKTSASLRDVPMTRFLLDGDAMDRAFGSVLCPESALATA